MSANDLIIKSIRKEADQNYVHKDLNYKAKPMAGWQELLDELKKQVTHLREVCASALPDNITLNFVPHEKELFRQVHKISPEDEVKSDFDDFLDGLTVLEIEMTNKSKEDKSND